jgi:hypothetical protein
MLKIGSPKMVEEDKRMKTLDVKTYASICAFDEV